MKGWPDESISCCISSPPYWALRDYGVDGQLGLEPTFEEYIDKLCSYYDEVKRILCKDGTCWVNIADTYGGNIGGREKGKSFHSELGWDRGGRPKIDRGNPNPKSLCLIPQRFAIEMVNRGWILRNVIIWSKPNPMPSSAKDRFTVDFEYVFFFVKSQRYFFEPQYEPSNDKQERTYEQGGNWIIDKTKGQTGRLTNWKDKEYGCPPLGRNKRTTWIIPTQPTPDAHFATFPEDLVRPMVKAGCPRYVCKKCGTGRTKAYCIEKSTDSTRKTRGLKRKQCGPDSDSQFNSGFAANSKKHFKGYSDCGCGAGFRPGVMLDPFVVLAVPARWRPKRGWIISGLILRQSMLKNLQGRMFGKLTPAYQ